MSIPQTRKSPAATGLIQNNTQHQFTPSTSPAQVLLPRLDGVQKAGQGWRARCPACGGKSRKLAVSEGDDGRLLLHCFAGCPAGDVVAAVGLSVADLFVKRDLRTMTPGERATMRQAALVPRWKAALEVLAHEINVLLIAGRQLAENQPLANADLDRVRTAVNRVSEAREVLRG